MAARTERETSAPEVTVIDRTADLLGGSRIFQSRLHGPLDVHEALNRGLPREALTHLMGNVRVLHNQALVKSAIGVSLRTSQRAKVAPGKPLNKEQSGRVWKLPRFWPRPPRCSDRRRRRNDGWSALPSALTSDAQSRCCRPLSA